MQSEPNTEPVDIEVLRTEFTRGCAPIGPLAKALGVTERTIYSFSEPHQPKPLPYVRLGTERWYNIEETKQWLAERSQRQPPVTPPAAAEPAPPRGRGRPRRGMKNGQPGVRLPEVD